MFFRKKKTIKYENFMLKQRVEQLENILCPHNLHDWKFVRSNVAYAGTGHGDERYEYFYVCSKCKKLESRSYLMED